MARILVGQLWRESHAFNPKTTRAESFTLYRGAAALSAQGGAGSALGGIIRRLRALGHTPAPTLAAQAPPSGRVDHGFCIQQKAADFCIACKQNPHADVAPPLVARTPGIGSYVKALFPYRKARFHPEHPIPDPDLSARLFGRLT